MRNHRWIVLLVGLLACGLLAAGCGDDDESTTTPAAIEETTAEETTAADDTAETTTEETTTDSEDVAGATPDDVYNACVDVIEGTAAEEAAMPSCEQARDAFEQCLSRPRPPATPADAALGICQDAADQAIKTLEAAG